MLLYQLTIIIIHITIVISLNTHPNDLLSGEGLFSSASLGTFHLDSSHTTTFLNANSTNVLKLEKPTTSTISYEHGLLKTFSSSTPQHISFEFSSISTDTQDANFRLMRSSDNATILLFRAGRGGFARVNENQMVTFYNSSVTQSDSNVVTMKIDLKINWASQTIQIFVNDGYVGNCKFFKSGVTSADQILIYNLYQSTSYWKNIVVCSPLCYDFNFSQRLQMTVLMIGIIMITMFLFY